MDFHNKIHALIRLICCFTIFAFLHNRLCAICQLPFKRDRLLGLQTGCLEGLKIQSRHVRSLRIGLVDKGNQIDIVFAVLDDNILKTGIETLQSLAPQYAVI